jgi:hypothetical protein
MWHEMGCFYNVGVIVLKEGTSLYKHGMRVFLGGDIPLDIMALSVRSVNGNIFCLFFARISSLHAPREMFVGGVFGISPSKPNRRLFQGWREGAVDDELA